MNIHLVFHLSVCTSVFLSICLSVSLSVHLSVRLSVFLLSLQQLVLWHSKENGLPLNYKYVVPSCNIWIRLQHAWDGTHNWVWQCSSVVARLRINSFSKIIDVHEIVISCISKKIFNFLTWKNVLEFIREEGRYLDYVWTLYFSLEGNDF